MRNSGSYTGENAALCCGCCNMAQRDIAANVPSCPDAVLGHMGIAELRAQLLCDRTAFAGEHAAQMRRACAPHRGA